MREPAVVERCEGCGKKVPDWPAGWLRTDDGVNWCPLCRKPTSRGSS